MFRIIASLVMAALVGVAPAYAAGGNVQVTIHEGRVSVMAKNASLREILEAWARVGQTVIVNADGLSTAPITLELVDLPETQALDVLCRSTSGYLAMPRPAGSTSSSRFERIVILPTRVADSGVRAMPPVPAPPTFVAPAPPQIATPTNGVARLIGSDGLPVEDDQRGAPPPPTPAAIYQSAPFGVAPPPAPPAALTTPSGTPSATAPTRSPAIVGSPVPGMIVPAVPQNPPPPAPQR